MLNKTNVPAKKETTAPTVRTPWPMFDEMLADFERFWERPLLARFPFFHRTDENKLWSPKLDVFRQGAEMIVKADLPGLKREEVSVTLEEGDLVLQGERKEEKEVKEDEYYRCERTYGSFYRRLPLGFEVDPQKVMARFSDGVLEVRLPVPPEAESTKKAIEVH